MCERGGGRARPVMSTSSQPFGTTNVVRGVWVLEFFGGHASNESQPRKQASRLKQNMDWLYSLVFVVGLRTLSALAPSSTKYFPLRPTLTRGLSSRPSVDLRPSLPKQQQKFLFTSATTLFVQRSSCSAAFRLQPSNACNYVEAKKKARSEGRDLGKVFLFHGHKHWAHELPDGRKVLYWSKYGSNLIIDRNKTIFCQCLRKKYQRV